MSIIILGGIKHCGKTSLGRSIAQNMHCNFYDLDNLILNVSNNSWETVRDIWKDLGKYEFIRLEAEAARTFVEWIIPSDYGQNCILSLGGATIENSGAMSWLKNLGVNVYIRASSDILYKRIMSKGRPPFLSEDNALEDFQVIYKHRNAMYEKFADLIHDVDDSPLHINAQRLLTSLEKNNVR